MPSTRRAAARRRAIADPKRGGGQGSGRDPLSELFGEFPDRLRGDRWQPAVDVYETEEAVVVRVEIAGVRAEDIRVSVDGDLLRISGIRRVPSDASVKRLHQMEIAFGPFERALRVQIPIHREHVSAHLEDGFLEVQLPKRGPQRIEVQSG